MLHYLAKILPVGIHEQMESFILKNYGRTRWATTKLSPEFFEVISGKKLLSMFRHAAKNVPGYQKFLAGHGIDPSAIRTVGDFNAQVVETNKDNYIRKYSYEDRCVNGKFPHDGNIDESSGSSGKPTNWIRSIKEESLLFNVAQFEFNYCYDVKNKQYIVLSAWSTGPWATGIKFCEIIEHSALVKSTDTDVGDIIETLKLFGPKYNYLIAGYPPFLKKLVDEGADKIRWKDFKIDLMTGGEGNIIEWNYYMKDKLGQNCKIVSSYGCSDIDIGIGFETDFSFFIRELCNENRELREALFGHGDKLPMIFQYNPLMHYIRQIPIERADGSKIYEYEITLLDKNVVSPKIKYNLKDEGGVIKFNDMLGILGSHVPDFLKRFQKRGHQVEPLLRLPFLYIVDRSDGTISLDGANIYPHQIERCIHRDRELLANVHLFKMALEYNKKKNSVFKVMLELKEGIKPSPLLAKNASSVILRELQNLNYDYRESYTNDKILAPVVALFRYGEGPFHPKFKNIKHKYIHS